MRSGIRVLVRARVMRLPADRAAAVYDAAKDYQFDSAGFVGRVVGFVRVL